MLAEVVRAAASVGVVLHGDLTRAGFYPRFPQGPLKLSWRKELHRELTGTRCEVIVGEGLAFMGTYAGNLCAWDAATGQERWVFRTGGPIGHSPMYADGTVYRPVAAAVAVRAAVGSDVEFGGGQRTGRRQTNG